MVSGFEYFGLGFGLVTLAVSLWASSGLPSRQRKDDRDRKITQAIAAAAAHDDQNALQMLRELDKTG